MKKRKVALRLLGYLILISLFATCKKEIKEIDFASNINTLKVYDLNGEYPFAQIKRPGGGYFLVYEENVNKQKDVSVAVTDDVGNVTHKTTFGGSKGENIYSAQVDGDGNLYVCGSTVSPELRMDKNALVTNKSDGYLAKLDKDGNLLWQRGYSDTTSFKKGTNNDGFSTIYLINNKLYCIGLTGNRYNPSGPNGTREYDLWMVTFDENGNLLKNRFLPSIYRRASILNYGGSLVNDGIKLSNNDLIIRCDFKAFQGEGRNMDTTALLFRYTIASDSVMWTKYYSQSSPQGDICYGGLLANGNVAFFDSYWNTINIMDVNNGNVISTTTVNNNTASVTSNQYYSDMEISPFNIKDDLYFVGSTSIGGVGSNLKPFAAKLNREGTLVYNKTFDIPGGYYSWITENGNKNLQLMGGIKAFNKGKIKIFTLTMDENANVINQ